MECPGPPRCGHTCEHRHCFRCGEPVAATPLEEKIAEFVRDFGRAPTDQELSQPGCCGDCYAVGLAIEKGRQN